MQIVKHINFIITTNSGITIDTMKIVHSYQISVPGGFSMDEAIRAANEANKEADATFSGTSHATFVMEDRSEVDFIMELTEEAYSRERYGEAAWRAGIEYLVEVMGVDACTGQTLMDSKLPRHAGDECELHDGTVPVWAIATYCQRLGEDKISEEYL